MRVRNINLPAHEDDFLEWLVNTGKYQNASEAIRDALHALQQNLRDSTLKPWPPGTALTNVGRSRLERSDFNRLVGADVEKCVKCVKGLTSTQIKRMLILLYTLASCSHSSASSLSPVLNGGALRVGVTTQRSLRRDVRQRIIASSPGYHRPP